MQVVMLLSGGMDSSVLLFHLLNDRREGGLHALSFDYGQRHARELLAAHEVFSVARERYGSRFALQHDVVDLTPVGRLLSDSSSALTNRNIEVPEGHYTDESMKATVVPNRNMVMLSIGAAVAVAEHAEVLAFAAHAGDHAIYPDCRLPFISALNSTVKTGNSGFIHPGFVLDAPFIWWDKSQIAALGEALSVPFEKTWTCYKGRVPACGRCATCVERLEAFHTIGAFDPIVYADRHYFKKVTKGG
jgi:7-cyano-7-deazaguanine synthase